MATYKMAKPFEYEGKTYEEITLELDKLTGETARDIEAELKAENQFVASPAYDDNYRRLVAVKASKIPENVFLAMPMQDYLAIGRLIKNFLMGLD